VNFVELTMIGGDKTLINMDLVVQILKDKQKGHTVMLYEFVFGDDYAYEFVEESMDEIATILNHKALT